MVQCTFFHRAYVIDDKPVNGYADSNDKPLQRRVTVSVLPQRHVRYYLPTSESIKLKSLQSPVDERVKWRRSLFGPELVSLVVRLVTLNAVDRLIELEYRKRRE
jgi:hypothetical protein